MFQLKLRKQWRPVLRDGAPQSVPGHLPKRFKKVSRASMPAAREASHKFDILLLFELVLRNAGFDF